MLYRLISGLTSEITAAPTQISEFLDATNYDFHDAEEDESGEANTSGTEIS
jgi:hypothetical protein